MIGLNYRGAGDAMAPLYFGRSVDPISTRGDKLCPPNYYWHPLIFRPSNGPVKYSSADHDSKKMRFQSVEYYKLFLGVTH